MGARSPDIVLNEVPYLLFEAHDVDAFREYGEPKHVQEPDVVGSTRPNKNPRNDILTLRWDDWSRGEGQFAYDARDEDTWRKYFFSKGAVDISTPGEIKLGLALTQSYASGATTYSQGPYLVATRYSATLNPHPIGFLVDQKVFMHDDTALVTTDTWNDMGNAAADAGNRIAGPPRALGGYIYAAYKDGSGVANSSRVRRITAADPDVANITTAPNAAATMGTVTQANAENAIPADNRVYVFKDATGKLDVYRMAIDLALPGTFDPVDSAKGAGSEAGVAALGKRLHIVTQYVEEEPRIRLYDGQNGYEREVMPEGFRMDTTPYDAANFLGDILYLAGYEVGRNDFAKGSIGWMAPGRTGSWLIRDHDEFMDTSEPAFGYAPGKMGVSLPGVGNKILFASSGVGAIDVDRGIYQYDAAQGSISQFIDLESTIPATSRVTSMRYFKGLYWIATHLAAASGTAAEVRIYRTAGSGSAGAHPASTTVFSSYHDFGYREEEKVLRALTIEVAAMPTGCSVTIELEDERGQIITTDKNGADLKFDEDSAASVDQAVTSKTFQLSGLDEFDKPVTRTAKAIRIRMTMAGDGTNTPTVRCIAVDADITGYSFFYDVVLGLQDQNSFLRLLDRQVSGVQQMDNIRQITRKENGIKQVIAFDPRFIYDGGQGAVLPADSVNPDRYPVAVEIVDFDLRGAYKANGFVKLRLREV